MTVPFLTFTGDHYRAGAAQGEWARKSLRSAAARPYGRLGRRLFSPRCVPATAFLALQKNSLKKTFAARLKESPIKQRTRLNGIADGAGLEEWPFRLWLAFETECVRHLLPIHSPHAAWIERSGGPTQTAALTAASNPAPPGLDYFIRKTDIPGRLDALSAVTPDQAGAFFGVNERGLAIAWTSVFHSGQRFGGPIPSLALQEALERAGNVDEAAGFLNAMGIVEGGSFTLAEPGRVAAAEIAGGKLYLREAAEGFLWSDCFFRSDGIPGELAALRTHRSFFSRLDPDPELEERVRRMRETIERLKPEIAGSSRPVRSAEAFFRVCDALYEGAGELDPFARLRGDDPSAALLLPERRGLIWIQRAVNGEVALSEFGL